MGRKPQPRLLLPALALLAACVTAGCGSSSGTGSKAPDYASALNGAPPPLAALYEQTAYGDHAALVSGGVDAFESELPKLHGHPAVVNIWGSWCGPCRQEYPYLQQASAKFGKHVAFLGVDVLDQTAAAKTFLGEDPIPYPSYEDPDGQAKDYFHVVGLPATVIYDSSGKLVHTNQGGYASQADLFADIKQYAQ
jgi:cytochrome c biogenesis protein CcmG/thiol:disulfide interchange protein DsbE